ncbi:tetratricopeptide repeat protein [Nonomuraea fuscirosea]|uniref:tetratricopeptide repeat protein n=1 Tax=Nonomuraea fuscirosea TaxID=1291556 RepID=UPI0033DB0A13
MSDRSPSSDDQRPPESSTAAEGDRSLAVGGDLNGIASTGEGATNVLIQADQASVLPAEAFIRMADLPPPPRLTNVPLHTGLFVGRVQALARLDEALEGPGGAVVQAVHGLGGIGKSTLAAQWAATRGAARHCPIWWITADNAAGIDAGLAKLATALQPALSNVLPLEALKEQALQWLASHEGWLVVLDNVDNPADVQPLLARAPHGRFLITSRRATGWHRLATPIALDVLDQAEAVELLSGILTHGGERDLTGIDELCTELGGLPLAIEQAGAYMTQADLTPGEYAALLADHPGTMYRGRAEGTDPARTVARVWHVTLDRLADDPLPGRILRILAWYAPDDIPRALLGHLFSGPELISAVGRLAAYSMITVRRDTLAVHRLVGAVARTPDPDDPHRRPEDIAEAREQAATALTRALPDRKEFGLWPVWRILLPHVDAVTHQAEPQPGSFLHLLMKEALLLRITLHAVAGKIEDRQRALSESVRDLGEDHPDTLTARDALAYGYEYVGEWDHSIPLHERNLEARLRLLGPDHPDTVRSRRDLTDARRWPQTYASLPRSTQQLLDIYRGIPGSREDG